MISFSKIQNINNSYIDFEKSTKLKNEINQFNKLLEKEKNILNSINNKRSNDKFLINKKLMKVCLEFESLFLSQMFKAMTKTLNKENQLLHGGSSEELFREMLIDKYSLNSVKNEDFGIAKNIYKNINYKIKI